MPAGSIASGFARLPASVSAERRSPAMREFAKGSFTLRQAPRPLRLIYAAFLLLVGVGIATELGFEIERIGLTPARVAAYYRGGEDATVMTFPKTFSQLPEVKHAHDSMMDVISLIHAPHLDVTSTY